MRLYVNIDHVATLRQARRTDEPDPILAAAAAERGGADGITVHLREDRRHIQDADVAGLMRTVRSVVNLELGASPEIVRIATRLKPFQATLVPERSQEITTEGGLALHGGRRDARVIQAVRRLTAAGIRVSLFIDPDRRTIDRAAALGVPAIELHTGVYARTWSKSGRALATLARAADHARAAGVAVHAGHGLTYGNVQPVARLAAIEELNIGHSVVSQAVFWGMEEAVRRMRTLVDTAQS
jgi:pyridoxine 5-phosphate synthase